MLRNENRMMSYAVMMIVLFEYAQLTGKERVNFDSDEWILLLSVQYDAERKYNKAEHL